MTKTLKPTADAEKPLDHARVDDHLDPLGSNSEIGRKLKQFYDGIVSDDVPDRFSELLGRLEAAEASRRKD